MNSRSRLSLFFALSLTAAQGARADSNIYITKDSLLVLWKNSAETIRKEALPAEEDPQGNWGAISYGYQLSIRFEKDFFVVGEPIIATILLRNTTSKPLKYPSLGFLTDYAIFVVDGHKNGTKIWEEFRNGSVGGGGRLNPMEQCKYQIRLDEHYDFSAKGEFLIYIRRQIPKSEPVLPSLVYESSQVVSGNAIIHVVDAPKTAGHAKLGKTESTTSPPRAASANTGAPPVVGWSQTANSQSAADAAAPKSAASTPKNILHPTPKATANKTPAQLAQAETGGGRSSRDWVFGLLVLGVVLGLVWYLFRARSPHPKS